MKHTSVNAKRKLAAAVAAVSFSFSLSAAAEFDSMAVGENGYSVPAPLLTIGETINGYTLPGVLDGLGATELDKDTVRVFANHELLHFRGYDYTVNDGELTMSGARVSYIDIDKDSRKVVDVGLAYDTVYDAFGNKPVNTDFLGGLDGFSRLCSSVMVEANEFGSDKKGGKGKKGKKGKGSGIEDPIYFTGEEDGGFFNPVGGSEWALDVEKGELWQVPDMGRGAWENITQVDTGDKDTVAFILADDSSPFDHDDDGVEEAAPLYLYLGEKQKKGDFLERNGLRGGSLYVWVANTGETKPSEFNTSGTLQGRWVEVDNERRPSEAQDRNDPDFDRLGYDENGYPTQGNLWIQAEDLAAFGFSRPEDVAYNPDNPSEVVLASTGVDTYDVDPERGTGADTFGTMYLIDTDFKSLNATMTIIYDGDADPSRSLRSPDNLDWADNGYIYVQEDKAEEATLSGDELLFGAPTGDFGELECDPNTSEAGLPLCARNPNEAGIVLLDPNSGATQRVANIDRSVILDASIATPTDAVDTDAGRAGEWESSGIIDVSDLFDEEEGTLFIFNVQAHGIEDQDNFNADSRIVDADLVEGGQLLFLEAPAED